MSDLIACYWMHTEGAVRSGTVGTTGIGAQADWWGCLSH